MIRRRWVIAGLCLAGLCSTAIGSLAPAAMAAPPGTTAPSASSPDVAPTGQIVHLSSSPGELQVLFSAAGLGTGQSIDPASVQLTLDGRPLHVGVRAIGATPPPQVVRTAMLVVDISGSMQAGGLTGAKQAADVFLHAVPTDVQVGLVTVSTAATVVAKPTTDRAALEADVGALTANGNTALYDGVLLALRALGTTAASRTIVLLTDGHDEGSATTLGQVAQAVQRSAGVVVDAVSFGTASAQVAPLQQLTSVSGGRILATDQAGDFAPAFLRAARDIATQVLVTASVPASLAGRSVNVQVRARVGNSTLSDSAFVSLVAAGSPASPPVSAFGPRPAAVHSGSFSSSGDLAIGLVAIFVGLLGVLGVLAWNSSIVDAPETRVRRRLSFYTLTGRGIRQPRVTTALGDSSVARSAVRLAGRFVVSRDVEARLGRRLEAAGVPLKPAEWIVVQVGSAVGLGVLLLLLGGGSAVAAVLGVVIGVGGTVGYLVLKESRRSSAFLGQLPDTLQLLAGSLSVGHSLPQAMDAVVREEMQPMSVEFNRALVETRLGMPVEDALEGISARMSSRDLAWVVMAIRIQREVGGNLAEILTTVASTIRERERLHRQVKGLSAEGRLSAWIIGALTPLFMIYLVLVQPDYIRPLFADPLGIALLVIMLLALGIGIFWLSRIVKVEV